ncbi:MAG: hypothetical protein RLZZ301_1354 [Bacteroidota bacterium]
MKTSAITLLFIGLVPFAYSQADPCSSSDKKISKSIADAIVEPSYEAAMQALAEIAKKYPDYAVTYSYLGQLNYAQGSSYLKNASTANEGEQLLRKALLFYQACLKKCPSFSSDAYYYSALLLYRFSEKEASLVYMEGFMNFDSLFPDQVSERYAQQKKELNEVYQELAFARNAKANPVPFEVQLVTGVSSPQDEYFPMLSPDNDFLFYTRKADLTHLGDIGSNIQEQFTVSERQQSDVRYSDGEALKAPFNDGSFTNYGAASLSVDNREMVICACKVEKVYNKDYLNCDLYTSTFARKGNGGNDFQWGPLQNMGPSINTKDGWEGQPSLSADGRMLFFTSLRKGSRDNDIYYSERQADGTWSPAKPFDVVNTAGKDKSPFFHQDGETLYFVSSTSRSRPGMGGLDLYYIRKENGSWTSPKNIGFPINSPQDELGIFVSTSGKVAYFSSQQAQNWDIYAFDLYPEARPKEVVILTGSLTDESGKAITNAQLELTYNESGESVSMNVHSEDGRYATAVKVDQLQDLTLTVTKENYSFQAQTIQAETLKSSTTQKVEAARIQVDSLIEGKAYTIADIRYHTDSYELDRNARVILLGFSKYLKQHPQLSVRINGHTDDLGNDQTNLLLSQQRADEVKRYLESLGIDASRLEAKGFGESKPRVANEDEESRAKKA